MTASTLFSLSAIIAILPSALLPLRRDHGRDVLFWLLLAVAVMGPLALVLVVVLHYQNYLEFVHQLPLINCLL